MTEFNIKIAGHVFKVEAEYASTLNYCKDYLTSEPADYSIHLTKEAIAEERLQLGYGTDEYLEKIALHRSIVSSLTNHNVFLFHGSALAVDGNGYIFTAPSGTGKSTHARYWRDYFGDRCIMINDDKPLLKVEKDALICYGSPWNGKHRLDTNISVPVKAIVLLTRDNYNHIEKKNPEELFDRLYLQTFRPTGVNDRKKTFAMLAQSMKLVDVYQLGCTMDPKAAVIAYKGMNK